MRSFVVSREGEALLYVKPWFPLWNDGMQQKRGEGEMSKGLTTDNVFEMFPQLHDVKNVELAQKAALIWVEAFENSSWENIMDAQFATRAPGVPVVLHTQGVVECSVDVAKSVAARHGYDIDLDTVIVSAVLHDVCKLEEMDMGPEGPGTSVKNHTGKLYQHGFLSGYYAQKYDLPTEITAICVAHSGQSKVILHSMEAMIVIYADLMNADIHFAHAGTTLCMEVD